jgi:hypothetical protein
LSSLRQSDLIRILDDVTERSARLQAETRELERTRDRLRSSSDGRRTALEETRKRAETLGHPRRHAARDRVRASSC